MMRANSPSGCHDHERDPPPGLVRHHHRRARGAARRGVGERARARAPGALRAPKEIGGRMARGCPSRTSAPARATCRGTAPALRPERPGPPQADPQHLVIVMIEAVQRPVTSTPNRGCSTRSARAGETSGDTQPAEWHECATEPSINCDCIGTRSMVSVLPGEQIAEAATIPPKRAACSPYQSDSTTQLGNQLMLPSKSSIPHRQECDYGTRSDCNR